jgi:hypothetical protein
LHYLYFILTCFIASIIFWGSSTPPRSVRYVDSLFLAVSAMTEAGLNTVNLSTLNTWQQIMLFFLIMLGSSIWVSAFVVHVRRKAFETRFREEIERERRRRGGSSWFPLSRTWSWTPSKIPGTQDGLDPELPTSEPQPTTIDQRLEDSLPENKLGPSPSADNIQNEKPGKSLRANSNADESISPLSDVSNVRVEADGDQQLTSDGNFGSSGSQPETDQETNRSDHITFHPDTRFRRRVASGQEASGTGTISHRLLSLQGVGARPNASTRRLTLQPSPRLSRDMSRVTSEDRSRQERLESYIPESGFRARNSSFYDLSESDRIRLGGAEYEAVVFLSWVVPIYFFLWQLLGCLACGAYVNNYYASTTEQNGINPYWTGAFNAVSAFNNSGMSLLDANMTVFDRAIYLLLTMGLLILAGNTMYPVFLRWIVWTIRQLLPRNEEWSDARATLQFLLDHPRRCYTNMFPAPHTWWLLLSVIVLNGIDTVMFIILNVSTNYNPKLIGSSSQESRFITQKLLRLALGTNSLMASFKPLPSALEDFTLSTYHPSESAYKSSTLS